MKTSHSFNSYSLIIKDLFSKLLAIIENMCTETKERPFIVSFWFISKKKKALPYGLFYESLKLWF